MIHGLGVSVSKSVLMCCLCGVRKLFHAIGWRHWIDCAVICNSRH
jgi:hypothetical protein